MTNQEINERVAKLCGWRAVECKEAGLWHLEHPDGRVIGFGCGLSEDHAKKCVTPDYAESLDACRSFERTLDTIESTEYAVHLRRIVTRNTTDADKHPDTGYVPDGRYYCAAPIERCEAFLRLKGQWE